MHLLGDLAAMRRFKRPQIVLGLRVQPKPRAIAEVKPETQCRIRRYSAFAVEDFHDPTEGTPRAIAKRLALSLRAANSRFSSRPGCVGTRIAYSLQRFTMFHYRAVHNLTQLALALKI